MYHVALSHDTKDILLYIAGGKYGGVNVSITVYVSSDTAYETHADWYIPGMMHRGIWNIDPSCIIITRVTQSADINIYDIRSYLLFCFWG